MAQPLLLGDNASHPEVSPKQREPSVCVETARKASFNRQASILNRRNKGRGDVILYKADGQWCSLGEGKLNQMPLTILCRPPSQTLEAQADSRSQQAVS